MSYKQKKDIDKMTVKQVEPEENITINEKSPEFDVIGTALNDLHSPFEF
ncbi:hypothetical protein P9D43_25030 [Neobacillus niacini]|nr:hypothetical protein [Neobacillus niacini]MEC1525264.1 hypothetical protein [Neobacillus niacini]